MSIDRQIEQNDVSVGRSLSCRGKFRKGRVAPPKTVIAVCFVRFAESPNL